MKTLFNILITALICLTLTEHYTSSIIARKLKGDEEGEAGESTLDKLRKDLEAYFDEEFEEFNPVKKDGANKENIEYIMEEKKAEITIHVAGSEVTAVLKNSYETQDMKLENIDFKTQKDFITENYVGKFKAHLSEIIETIPNIFASVQKGLADSKDGDDMFGPVKEVSDRRRERLLAKTKKKAKSKGKAKAKGKAKGGAGDQKPMYFEMEYVNKNLKMGSDPILGEIALADGKYQITIITKFFQKTYQLAVNTEGYVTKEATNLGNKALAQLSSMYSLNEGDGDEGDIERKLEFETYVEGLDGRLTKVLGDGFDVDVDEAKVSIKHDGKEVADVAFSDVYVSDMVFRKIVCTVEALGGDTFNLVLPYSSIYNLKAVVDKFLMEIMDHVKHACNATNPDEAVPVFEE